MTPGANDSVGLLDFIALLYMASSASVGVASGRGSGLPPEQSRLRVGPARPGSFD